MITFSKGFIHINAQCAVLYSVDVVLFFRVPSSPRSIFLYFFRVFSYKNREGDRGGKNYRTHLLLPNKKNWVPLPGREATASLL